jgi:tRNA(Glu) U13 pseudouridine synthase TruD
MVFSHFEVLHILIKMLQGMQRFDKKNDSRKPIAIDILKKILKKLLMLCTSNYKIQ